MMAAGIIWSVSVVVLVALAAALALNDPRPRG
jgi:hypothetical protein